MTAPDVPPESWTEIGAERVAYEGFIKVVVRRYRLPNGTEADWDLLDTPPTVVVLALTQDDQVVLVEQYRPGPARVVLSLPGGLVDPGESPAAAAARELLEETGYCAQTLDVVGSIEPISSTTPWHVAVAHGCVLSAEQALDELEDIRVVLLPLDELRRRLTDGTVGTLAQAYLALDHLGLL